ncbi:MAG TPA: acetate--CoA ligase family protein, partial [Streptosporangiaceae bacterium]
EFFAPRSIAMVGASDNSGWARNIVTSCGVSGFDGPLIPVHPKHETAFGRPVVPNLRDLDEPVDLAYILAPTRAVEQVIDDAADAGIRNAIVLASGYREVGGEGEGLQEHLIGHAAARGVTLLGPNTLGFLNAHTRSAPFGLTVPPPLEAGPVGIVLQSGALATAVLQFSRSRAIGVSLLASMGNEAMITSTDVINYLVEDDNTKVICLFLEQIANPAEFARAADRAAAAGKPIVALKVGASPEGQKSALAHTGAVAGDDAVVDAALRQMNVIRVNSLEELLSTGALLGYCRHPAGRRMGVLTASGGACDIIADGAHREDLAIPDFAPETAEKIDPFLPPFANARNPLDVTGYVLANARTGALTAIDHALDAAADDPNLDFVLFMGMTLPEQQPPEAMAGLLEERLDWMEQRFASSPIPIIPIGTTCTDVSPYQREMMSKHGMHLLGGIDLGLRAIGHALRWIEGGAHRRPDVLAAPAPSGRHAATAFAEGPWSEAAARDLLSAAGAPVVPGELVDSADAAVRAAERLGMPVAMKICSAQITHKSDIGGVALNLATADDVRAAYARVRDAGRKVPDAHVDGVLITPMRGDGVELLVGVTTDPTFGQVLTVGLGGVWVEIMRDTSLRVLPVDHAEVRRMLGELRGAALLTGARGTEAADLDRVAAAITAIGDAAARLDGRLEAIEVNPLWISGDRVEALDALVVTTAQPTPASRIEQEARA